MDFLVSDCFSDMDLCTDQGNMDYAYAMLSAYPLTSNPAADEAGIPHIADEDIPWHG